MSIEEIEALRASTTSLIEKYPDEINAFLGACGRKSVNDLEDPHLRQLAANLVFLETGTPARKIEPPTE